MADDSKKKVVGQVVIFIISFAIAFFVADYFLSSNHETPNAMLLENSRKVNRNMPKMLDSETRLDSTTVENDTITYHHTLINTTKDRSELDFDTIKTTMIEKAQNNLNTNPDMKDYRENNISVHYIFKDKDKNKVFDYTIKYQK